LIRSKAAAARDAKCPNRIPRYNERKEYESPLHEYRVAKYLTVKELSTAAKVSITDICALANGLTSPIYLAGERKGKPKPAALSISRVLGVSFEDLFPRYFCRLRSADSQNFTSDQIEEITVSKGSRNATDVYSSVANREVVGALLSSIRQRELRVIICRFYLGLTLGEISKRMGLTKECIRMIQSKAIQKMRQTAVAREIVRTLGVRKGLVDGSASDEEIFEYCDSSS
jgi:RNA polymerase sigma factor (sigma-70 family)